MAIKAWLTTYLKEELHLELSAEKTLVTNARNRVRFLGYDIVRWKGERRVKYRVHGSPTIRRSTNYHLSLLIPHDKCVAFAKTYGNPQSWRGRRRNQALNLSELEILMLYNAEIRGFLGYYALADNFSSVASRLLWLTTTSFLLTLADKRNSSIKKVARSLKQGPNRYVITLKKQNGTMREYALVSSMRQLERKTATYGEVDLIPYTWKFRSRSELGQRLLANECEWCGTQHGLMEVHHVRKLKDLEGKTPWECQMIARRRKTMVLCKKCHVDLHAGRLTEATKAKG